MVLVVLSTICLSSPNGGIFVNGLPVILVKYESVFIYGSFSHSAVRILKNNRQILCSERVQVTNPNLS